MAPAVSRLVRFGALMLFLLAFVLVPFVLWGDAVEAWAAQRLSGAHSSLPVAVAGFALLTVDVLLPVPSSMVGVVLGAALGAANATLVAAAGLTLGCGLGYLIGRMAGPRLSRYLVRSEELDVARAWLSRRGVLMLALLRPVPVLAEISIVAAGLMGLSPVRVLGVTALANIGVSAVYASLGAAISGLVTFGFAMGAALVLPGLAFLGADLARGLRSSALERAKEGRLKAASPCGNNSRGSAEWINRARSASRHELQCRAASPRTGRGLAERVSVSCVQSCVRAQVTCRCSEGGEEPGEGTMTDSKDKKTTVTLEPGQVAVVLGMEGQEVTRQLFAAPEIDAVLDEEEADIPFNYFLASAFLTRLDEDEDFASDLADWYDERLQAAANEAVAPER